MEKKEVKKAISIVLLYLIHKPISIILLLIVGINYYGLPVYGRNIYNLIYEIVLTSIIIYLYKDIFLNCLKDFFKNIGYYLKSYLKYWVLALALMIFSNAIINFFDVSVTSSNQQSIIDSLINFPIYTLIETVFLAPILEELTFRLSFRKLFKNDYVFIFLSGIVFGSLHVIGEQNLLNYLYIIPYSIPGFIFAYTLVKSKNICVPISLHFIHNLFMMILEIITIFYI